MRISVSNIAWPATLDREALRTLRVESVNAVEIAPTRVWPDWNGASAQAAARLCEGFGGKGLRISSMQAILFGKPDCLIFGNDSQREQTLEHLQLCADLAAAMGADNVVFGAPKNRDPGAISERDAFHLACELFGLAAGYYHAKDVCLCLEANPIEYGCRFVTNSRQAGELVRAVDSPGFRLHLDTACMYLAHEDAAGAIRDNRDILSHFHVSEPSLGPFRNPVIDHRQIAFSLQQIEYRNWVALEMRATDEALADVSNAIRYVRDTYGEVSL